MTLPEIGPSIYLVRNEHSIHSATETVKKQQQVCYQKQWRSDHSLRDSYKTDYDDDADNDVEDVETSGLKSTVFDVVTYFVGVQIAKTHNHYHHIICFTIII